MQYSNPHIELCLEGSYSLFRGLSNHEKEIIEQHHALITVNKGGYLLKEGEKTRGPVFLSSGKAKIYRAGVGGREHILRMVQKQEIIGYGTLFGENIWSESSMAIEDSVICILEKQSLLKILKNNAEAALKLSKVLSEELSYLNDRIISLTQKHVRGRLVESLLMLGEIYGFEADGKTINASLSRDDIAHLSNMTTSNAIRTLSNLASEGRIAIKGRKITLLDTPGLEQISEQA